jgi:hypothetical protein
MSMPLTWKGSVPPKKGSVAEKIVVLRESIIYIETHGRLARIPAMARIEECKKCRELFAVTAGEGGLTQSYEDIDCPHCGDMWGREKTAGAYSTKPLTPEQKEEYRLRKR